MVMPTQRPAYILLKDGVGLKRPPRRVGLRIGSQKLFTACAGGVYLANKDEKQPQDKTMISLISLNDTKRILVAPKEHTRLLSTAELNMLLPIGSDEKRVNLLSGTVFYEAVTSQINDVITVHDGDLKANGKIRYVGKLPWKQYGVYIGVEFEEPLGDNNGCDLFNCEEKHAKFITADKIEKFIFKNERTHYAVNERVVKSNANKASKIYKRLSIPIFNFTKTTKPKLRASQSLDNITQDEDHIDKLVGSEKEIHYAVSNLLQNNNDTNKTNEEKKKQKRRSFPLSVSLRMKKSLRWKSKSLQDISDNNVENPYYARSSENTSSLEKISENPEPLVMCFNHGCDVKLEREKLTAHEENDCKFALEKCPNEGCDLEIRRKDINRHDITECEYAIIKCQNQGCQTKAIRKLMNQHLLSCAPDENKETKTACEPQDQYEYMALNGETQCPVPRCLYNGTDAEVCKHLCSEHCSLLMQHLSDLKTIFANDEETSLSDLYAKPIKTNKDSLEESCQRQNPLYSTPINDKFQENLANDEHVYLSPCDSIVPDDIDGHVYLSPCDTPKKHDGELNNNGKSSSPSHAIYECLSPEFKI